MAVLTVEEAVGAVEAAAGLNCSLPALRRQAEGAQQRRLPCPARAGAAGRWLLSAVQAQAAALKRWR